LVEKKSRGTFSLRCCGFPENIHQRTRLILPTTFINYFYRVFLTTSIKVPFRRFQRKQCKKRI
jgi:hypothetical protein